MECLQIGKYINIISVHIYNKVIKSKINQSKDLEKNSQFFFLQGDYYIKVQEKLFKVKEQTIILIKKCVLYLE